MENNKMGQNMQWNGRWARVAKWGGGALAVVGVLGFFVAPPLVRSVAESALTQALHRPVSIEGVSINPYALSAEVRGVRIEEPGGGAEAAGFKSLYANLEAESLFRGGVVVKEVQVVEPHVSVIRLEGNRYNWSDLIDEILNKPDDGSKTYFAVHNIRVDKGRVDFDDRPTGQKHALADLDLGVPFVSNLPSQVDVYVEPLLAMKVDGTPFEIRGKAQPFSATRASVVQLKFEGFDLTPYLAYVPMEKPFRLPSARLSSDLELAFAQPAGQAPDVSVKGQVGLEGFELQDAEGHPAVKLPHVVVGIERLAPLAGEVALGTVAVEQPEVVVSRDRDGGLNLLRLVPRPATQPAAGAGPSSGPRPAADTAPEPSPARPLAVTLGEFKLTGGKVQFADALPGGVYRRTLEDVHVSLRKFDLAGKAPAALDAGFRTDLGESVEHAGSVALAPLHATGTVTLDKLDLPGHALYYAAALKQADVFSGRFDARLAYDFAADGETPRVTLKGEVLSLKDLGLRLKGEKDSLARLGLLELRDVNVETAARKVEVGEVVGKATRLALVRDAEGRFNAEKLAATDAPPPPSAREKPVRPVARSAPKAAPAGPAWQVAVRHLALDDWGVRVEDRTLSPAIVFNAEPLSVQVDGLSTAKGSKAKVAVKASINKRGRFGLAGTVGLAPLAGALDVDLSAVDLAMLQPYVTEKVNIAITRGVVTSKGRLAFELPDGAAMKGGFKGNLTIGDFASVDKLNAADFLKWRSLYFGGVDVRLAPLALNIDEIALTNFYTRLILDEQGGLNIREITAERAREQKRAKDAARAPGTVRGPAPAATDAKAATATSPPAPAAPLPPIAIKRITLQGGNIAYSDRFVKPNYDANLTGMGGVLSGLSSDPTTLADLDLRGKVDNAAPVEVAGRLNPFRQDKALDIRASVTDFELSGVSTYAGKYVGYGIEKGKLSAKLNYKVEDRKLTATNQVFLDQLIFGDKVDSPDALKLPVQLAVSLLKNSRGEIDLDLPISGTLDDPQFSVGGIIVKVIVNLIGKALTSPFALLGSLFGGNAEELAWLEFDPGFARIGDKGEAKLKAIAKAMIDRPGIKLEISGRVDPDADRDGLRRAAMQGRVEALKVKEMAKKGEAAGEDGRVRIDPAEYPVLLARVYKDADFVKPRTMLGLTKDLPVPEMEKLLIANARVSDEDLPALAQQRAQAVKTWLIEQGKIPGERIFLLAPRVGKGGKDVNASLSRVDFSMR